MMMLCHTNCTKLKISPLAQRIADLEGLNIEVLQGSGPNGKIMSEDVLKLLNGTKEEVKGCFRAESRKYTNCPNRC